MISMKNTTPLKVSFDWLGPIPADDRKPGTETKGHISFFCQCMWCDRYYNNHLVKCDSEEELVTLFKLYAERLKNSMPFKLLDEDFRELAANTWKDPDYQAARAKKRKKK